MESSIQLMDNLLYSCGERHRSMKNTKWWVALSPVGFTALAQSLHNLPLVVQLLILALCGVGMVYLMIKH